MPRKTAEYPDWVMKYKKKGTYINKNGDKYYLYAAHSERIKGTNKVKRVSDGYIGRITEKDGLIPASTKIKSTPVSIEVGLSRIIIGITDNIRTGIHRSFPKYADFIFSRAVLLYVYGKHSDELYEQSYLSIFFSDSETPKQITKSHTFEIERCRKMIAEVMKKEYDKDLEMIIRLFSNIWIIRIGEVYYLSGMTSDITELSEKYAINWEDPLWQR